MAQSSRRRSRAKDDETPAAETTQTPAADDDTADDNAAPDEDATQQASAADDTATDEPAASDVTPGAVSEGEYDYSPPASVAPAVQAPGLTGVTRTADSLANSPESAPLEPVAKPEAEEPAPPKVADVGVAFAAKANELFDEATGEAPDPDTLFQPLSEHSSARVCQVRLLERAYIGLYQTEITRVVIPAGTVLAEAQAEQVKVRLRRQADR